ncbi:hypothetical protein ZIOFF_051508 [Zingiber officinale]|uniref:Uncharacterized protein n=1 Tax=Zingiber officinale TaxID=94328 RepID=A0A8J5FMU8_ZINOF|nr:hypothetical protein ZIOFF_051508 [Zingiber officinale]
MAESETFCEELALAVIAAYETVEAESRESSLKLESQQAEIVEVKIVGLKNDKFCRDMGIQLIVDVADNEEDLSVTYQWKQESHTQRQLNLISEMDEAAEFEEEQDASVYCAELEFRSVAVTPEIPNGMGTELSNLTKLIYAPIKKPSSMASSKMVMAVLLIHTLMLISLSFRRSEAGQNCFCECMKKCIPIGMVSPAKCSKECDEACIEIGFKGKPEEGTKYNCDEDD